MMGTSESENSASDSSNVPRRETQSMNEIIPLVDHLSPGQERRVRTWLEEQFRALDQMYNRRYTLSTAVAFMNI